VDVLVNVVMYVPSSVKFWEVLEWLYNWRLLSKGSAA
jgi:hypothetical protein